MMFSYHPEKIKFFMIQKLRWNENNLIYSFQNKKILRLLRFLILFLFSIYLLIFPVLIFYNLGLFLIGFLILISLYLRKIRRIVFFKKTIGNRFHEKLGFFFFIKVIYYLYIELIVNILVPIDLFRFLRKLKK